MLTSCSKILAESICMTIRPEFRVPTDLFTLFAHDHSTKIYGPLSFNLSFVTNIRPKLRVLIDLFLLCAHGHSTEVYGPLSFILFFVHEPFDQKLRSSLIYFFHALTTIRSNYTVLFHLFFLLCTTIRPKIRVLINLIFFLVHNHSTKN